jgi:hypothetical protein
MVYLKRQRLNPKYKEIGIRCTLNKYKGEPLLSVSVLFRRNCRYILPIMYIYCVYNAMSKVQKQLLKYTMNRAETIIVLIV